MRRPDPDPRREEARQRLLTRYLVIITATIAGAVCGLAITRARAADLAGVARIVDLRFGRFGRGRTGATHR